MAATPNNEDVASNAPDASMTSTLQQFHPFPKLPPELRDMIFEFSLVPQLIRVDLEGGNMKYENTWENSARKLLPTTLNDSLMHVNRDARAVVRRLYGEQYVFVSLQLRPETPITVYTSPPAAFRPHSDTLFFPDMMPCCHMLWDCAFGRAADGNLLDCRPNQYSAYADIQSVVIGGLIERAAISPATDVGGPGPRSFISFIAYPRLVSNAFWGLLARLPNLREVIVVSPTVRQLCDQASRIKTRSDGAMGKLLEADMMGMKQNIEAMIDCSQTALKREGTEVLESQRRSGPHNPLIEYHGRPTVSDWWKDPIITWMTESELQARFALHPSVDLKTGPQFSD